jgi:hypothetical protein
MKEHIDRILVSDQEACVAKRKFVVTTDSGHPLPVYPNLAEGLQLSALVLNILPRVAG